MKKTLLLFTSVAWWGASFSQHTAIVRGEITNLKSDTLSCVLSINPVTWEKRTVTIIANQGKFQQTFQITKPTFFYIQQGNNYINGLLDPNDDVLIKYDAASPSSSLSFEGKGREKLGFLNTFDRQRREIFDMKKNKERLAFARSKQYPFDYLLDFLDSLEYNFLSQIDAMQGSIGKESFTLLKGLVKGAFLGRRYHAITSVHSEGIEETLQKRKTELTSRTKKSIDNLFKFDDKLFISPGYVNAVYNVLFIDMHSRQLNNKASRNLVDKYSYLDKHLPKNLKVPVLTQFLDDDLGKLNQVEDIRTVINKTYVSAKDSTYKNFITQKLIQVTTFEKGKPAPDFTLENKKGEVVSLASFRGKVVYMDFWYAACGPCHALFESTKSVKEHFKGNENVVFLNVSIDNRHTWEKALEKFNIDGYHVFTQNKGENHDIVKMYKVAGYPTTCIIDKKGNMFAATPSTLPDELLKQIKEALTQ